MTEPSGRGLIKKCSGPASQTRTLEVSPSLWEQPEIRGDVAIRPARKSAQALTHTDTKKVRCWRDGGRNSCTLEGVGLVRCGLEVKVRQLCFARVSSGRADIPLLLRCCGDRRPGRSISPRWCVLTERPERGGRPRDEAIESFNCCVMRRKTYASVLSLKRLTDVWVKNGNSDRHFEHSNIRPAAGETAANHAFWGLPVRSRTPGIPDRR